MRHAGPNWHPFPMVRLVIPLLGGIGAGAWMDFAPGVPLLLIPAAAALMIGLVRPFPWQNAVFGTLWFSFAFLAGWALVWHTDPLRQTDHWLRSHHQPHTETRWEAVVRQCDQTRTGWRLTLRLHRWQPDPGDPWQSVSGDLLLYIPAESDPAGPLAGDRVRFKGCPVPIPPSSDPVGFDWRLYQRIRGVTHQLFVYNPHIDLLPPVAFSWARFWETTRSRYARVLDQHLPAPESRQLARAIILGDRELLGDALNEAYQASGAVHVLAVSGLHVGLVAGLVMGLLSWISRARRTLLIRTLVALTLVWAYVGLTGASDSAIRAGVLFTVVLGGRCLSRHADSVNLLAAAVCFLVVYHPWILFHVGFQLSVAAVAGILLFQPIIERSWYPGHKGLAFFWSLFAVTLAAQWTTVMLSLYHFHRFPMYFILSGLFVVPLASLFLTTGVVTLTAQAALPPLATLSGWMLDKQALLMNSLVTGIAGLPGATWDELYPSSHWILGVPVFGGLLLFGWKKRSAAALTAAVATLALCTAFEAVIRYGASKQREWMLIRPFGEKTRLISVFDGHRVAFDLQEGSGIPQRRHWAGWGPVWVVPAETDMDAGPLSKRGERCRVGTDWVSWGAGPPGHYHICLPGRDLPSERPDSTSWLLAAELTAREKRHLIRRLPPDRTFDLRSHGLLVRPLADGTTGDR